MTLYFFPGLFFIFFSCFWLFLWWFGGWGWRLGLGFWGWGFQLMGFAVSCMGIPVFWGRGSSYKHRIITLWKTLHQKMLNDILIITMASSIFWHSGDCVRHCIMMVCTITIDQSTSRSTWLYGFLQEISWFGQSIYRFESPLPIDFIMWNSIWDFETCRS